MSNSIYRYGVVSVDGNHVFDDPVAALQYSVYMEYVGADSVFFLCAEFEGETKRLKRITAYDMIKAIRNGDSRGEAGSNEQQL